MLGETEVVLLKVVIPEAQGVVVCKGYGGNT